MNNAFQNLSFRMDQSVVIIDAAAVFGRAARGTGRTTLHRAGLVLSVRPGKDYRRLLADWP
ncbi:MAG: hypothetical protein OXI81_19915 [Paracoccaceae bacterium]|nr:hypothetical protein [Paracoccaceae bacterium]